VAIALCSLAMAVALGWVGSNWWYRRELARAEADLVNQQPASAEQRLRRIAWLGPDDPEALFLLGGCREARGDFEGALEAWSKIPRRSPLWLDATVRKAQFALAQGRFAIAEEAALSVQAPPGHAAAEACEQVLLQIYLFTIRYDEIGRHKEQEWSRSHRPEALRVHWLIDETKSFPVGATRDRLEQAGELAPDDDRVWLGKANLATRTGQKAEAERWLKRCLERRRDDPAVWLARLDWAMTFGLTEPAVEAARHIPADGVSLERVLQLRAWLASRTHHEAIEREALEQLLAREPGNTPALVRLADLATGAGEADLALRLRRRKAESDRANDDYRMLLTDDPYLKSGAGAGQPATDRERRLARSAEQLGRWFEARGWWTLVLERGGGGDEARTAIARLDRESEGRANSPLARQIVAGKTLADAMPDLVDVAGPGRRPSPRGSVAGTVPRFRDDAARAGLDCVYQNDPTPRCRMPETMGGGVGLLDFDGDGWLDVYVVQGGTFPDAREPAPGPQRDRLFRNRRDGTFEDVTARAGLTAFPGGYGHGVMVGDYDNDGHPDLFVTRWRSYALYRNRGDGTFEDATERAGLSGPRDWPTSAAFADLDGDGDLDLYVCHYAAWDPQTSNPCPHAFEKDRFMYCGPRTFDAMPDHLFRNDGGRFVDVSEAAGITAADREGRGLGVVAADLDDDGRIDLFVANDLTANFLFHNEGGLRFREMGMEAGVATNADGGYLAGMGVACGDLNGDGRIDLAVTNFYGESTTYYQGLGPGQFVDRTAAIGLATASRYRLGFGTSFFDADNDGRLDLATANGHVNDLRPHVPYAMPAQLLLGEGDGRLRDVSEEAGADWSVPRLGRGLACGDLDNDGRLDLLIVSEGQPLAFLHNEGPCAHFLTLKLEGASCNREGNGVRVTLTAGGRRQAALRYGGGSFLSAGDDRLHFGLGASDHVDAVEVRWPSGHVDRWENLEANTAYLVREGARKPAPLAGWGRR
jgi:tetratricopeptide (TPR) repeat protein